MMENKFKHLVHDIDTAVRYADIEDKLRMYFGYPPYENNERKGDHFIMDGIAFDYEQNDILEVAYTVRKLYNGSGG